MLGFVIICCWVVLGLLSMLFAYVRGMRTCGANLGMDYFISACLGPIMIPWLIGMLIQDWRDRTYVRRQTCRGCPFFQYMGKCQDQPEKVMWVCVRMYGTFEAHRVRTMLSTAPDSDLFNIPDNCPL